MSKSINFRSRKDFFFSVFLLGFSAMGLMLSYWILSNTDPGALALFGVGLTLITVTLLLWAYFGTSYRLSEKGLLYRNGPLRGKIALDRIREIEKGRTLWVGLRPATARKGLIIKYDKFEEVYISPDSNDIFIEKILELKKDIKIVDANLSRLKASGKK